MQPDQKQDYPRPHEDFPLIGAPKWVWKPEGNIDAGPEMGQVFLSRIKERDMGMWKAYEQARELRELVKAMWASSVRREEVKDWARVMRVWTQRKARRRPLFSAV